jgi:hypothetical protein
MQANIYEDSRASILSIYLLKFKIKNEPFWARFLVLAEWTGLEPATPGVTGRYSNQLNYHSSFIVS